LRGKVANVIPKAEVHLGNVGFLGLHQEIALKAKGDDLLLHLERRE
jgi:hypothetical protein